MIIFLNSSHLKSQDLELIKRLLFMIFVRISDFFCSLYGPHHQHFYFSTFLQVKHLQSRHLQFIHPFPLISQPLLNRVLRSYQYNRLSSYFNSFLVATIHLKSLVDLQVLSQSAQGLSCVLPSTLLATGVNHSQLFPKPSWAVFLDA